MHTITTVGLDIAKSVFQVHGVGAAGQVIKGISSCGCCGRSLSQVGAE